MIKIVYVYTGTGQTEYLNMLRISAASVRRHMPAVVVEAVTDAETGAFLQTQPFVHAQHIQIISADVPPSYSTVEKSRFLKTNLRRLVSGDFLYLDTDTIVCADISQTSPAASVSMVLDSHCPFSEQENGGAELTARAAKVGISLAGCTRYFNCGVILARDDEPARVLFRRWYETWERTRRPDMHHDQFSLNAVNGEMQLIEELDGAWNCQLTSGYRAFSYLRDVKILHYLSAQPYGIYRLNDSALLRGELTEADVEEIITHPERQFRPFRFYAEDSPEHIIMQQSQYHLVYRLYTGHPKLYRFGERLLSKFRK